MRRNGQGCDVCVEGEIVLAELVVRRRGFELAHKVGVDGARGGGGDGKEVWPPREVGEVEGGVVGFGEGVEVGGVEGEDVEGVEGAE